MYKVWFTEEIQWYVEIDAFDENEATAMIFGGNEKVWDDRDFVDSVIKIDYIEEM